MRRIFILLSFFLISQFRIYAAPAYGTDMPHKGGITMGYQANLVFNHKLSDSRGSIKSSQHFLDLSYGVYDWFTFDGKMGVGDIIQNGGCLPKIPYDSYLGGGYGFRVLLLDNPKDKTRVVFGFHHISIHPHCKKLDGNKYEALLDDWQFSVLGSKDFGIINPYLGLKVSRFDLVYKVNHKDRKRRPPYYYAGPIAGCNVRLKDNISLNVEGRFIDENSLSAGVYYSY